MKEASIGRDEGYKWDVNEGSFYRPDEADGSPHRWDGTEAITCDLKLVLKEEPKEVFDDESMEVFIEGSEDL